jgi:aconitate hydratase
MRTSDCERLSIGQELVWYYPIERLVARRGLDIATVPFAARVMLENVYRGWTGSSGEFEAAIDAILGLGASSDAAIPLQIGRVILPDSSGLPVLADLAALRDVVAKSGGNPKAVEPLIPLDLIVDHSLQVVSAGSEKSIAINLAQEYRDNDERYRFLKWAQTTFANIRVFPPGTGIIHQINMEYLASVIERRDTPDGLLAFPDLVLGCDSHTPMVNALGVIGWGVGGIDAEAAILGQPYVVPAPNVIGVELVNALPIGTTTTDLALTVTQRLRGEQVIGCIVEFFGSAVASMSIPQRGTLANMAVEYGATCGFFPVDASTLRYLETTGRTPEHVRLVEEYCKTNHLFRDETSPSPQYRRVIKIDLAKVVSCVAGPRRPQDLLALGEVAADFRNKIEQPRADGGFGVIRVPGAAPAIANVSTLKDGLNHGAIAIASITSCANTSNPEVMIAAGLLAQKAAAKGLAPPPWVKTSLAPGSQVVTRYLREADLLAPLETLGFHVIGYACTTCGGKSGSLNEGVEEAIAERNLVAAAVLSGNRNFESRIHPSIRANYLASPPLVVAYALAGTVNIDLQAEPLGTDADGHPVYLKDVWPASEEIDRLMPGANRRKVYIDVYKNAEGGTSEWNQIGVPRGDRFDWDPSSLYMVPPPFVLSAATAKPLSDEIRDAAIIGMFGDSLTTDHIAPSGRIPATSPAGRYLVEHGLTPAGFNTYSSRRCNHEVAGRATFSNPQIRNLMLPGSEGGVTRGPSGELMSFYDAAIGYQQNGVPLVVLAGKEYGSGSSRDWAAKGPALLGIRVIIAESFERIHRANLIGMGIIPLLFESGDGWARLGLTGGEKLHFSNLLDGVRGGKPVHVTGSSATGAIRFTTSACILTQSERDVLLRGNVFRVVLSKFEHLEDSVAPTR